MLAQEIAPTEIGKHANIIRAAQEELANMDVLVCGRCLRAFNFVEEFRSHKEDDACEKENSNLKESLDTKPTIWAFTLWKATQLHTRKGSNSSNSWALYQHWVKLEESVREPWIVAGRTIQSFGKIGHGQLQDMPVRITKTVVNPNNNNNNNSTANSNTSSSVSPTRKSPAGKLPTVASQLKDTENERPKSKPGTPTPTGASAPASAVGVVKNNNRIAIRVDPKTEQRTEEAVESIVAKRFNPRRRTHEYLVKWIDRSHNENTWEVMANLERVPYFLQMFEKQLARQKLKREKSLDALKRMQQEKQQQDKQTTVVTSKTDSAPLSPQSSAAVSPNSSNIAASRPSRTSKTKAMDQFKQWVNESGGGEGSTSPSSANEDESATEQDWSTAASTPMAIKRKLNHTDSSAEGSGLNASNESMELEDLEEDLIPSHTVKRLKNGGSSVQLNKPKIQTSMPTTTARINGNSSSSALSEKEPKMGEIIYTDDSTSTGMFRKPEMPNTIQTKRQKTEGPVRYLTRSEMTSNSRGIFRIDNSETSAVSPVHKSNPAASSANLPPAKRMAVARASGNSSPVTVGQRPHVLRTFGQGAPLQRRPVGASNTATPLRQGVPPTRAGPPVSSGRMVVARANTPQQRSVPGTKAVTPEQKILQLSKSGDLKVTRKVMTREDLLAQRAAQVRQQRQQQAQALQQQQQQQVQIQKVQQLTPLRQRTVNASAAKTMQIEMEIEQEELQQHQAQLCPITGKLIGQEETQLQMEQEQQQEQQREQLEAAAQELLGSEQQVLTNEDGSALLVRGEDGTVYQVAGKNAEGQTILVTQGPDGEQQFAYVAAAEGEDQDVLTLDNAVAEAVAAVGHQGEATADGEHILVSMTEEELAQHQAAVLQQQQQEAAPAGSTPHTAQIHITTSDSDGTEAQIPAEVVQADLPSPGGTRRVVLLLQDGTFMMTEMQEDQFKTLNIPT